jgi:putative ABC transport system permease protein
VIVSQSFARLVWPAMSPIGRIVQANPWGGESSSFEVIGVAEDIRDRAIRTEAVPTMYFDSQGWSWTDWEMYLVVRTASASGAVVAPIRSELGKLDATIPMAQVRSMDDYVSDDLAANRFTLLLVSVFAAVALSLAVMGLYGVVSYAVGQRSREFGLRLALGADRRSIVRLVLGDGVKLAGVGIAGGLLGALWVTDAFAHLLFGTSPQDPATFIGVASVLGAVALLACYVPARRAARVDPAETLRSM